ncbi:hypothetical protein PV325_005997 [Microctonus aethiopoides]|uniref:Inorganic phosphate cotransporter n=1 Tax=Microctonus aethiopoides TaxID=144406 RepID=A0AA39KLI5_9HYME|nr:hypothetical protein PV325_005997 [Microctonus aethiopoides]KAK0165910.1 hypothetical protein PV328_004387 [Microctonus aethiopoides]
MSGGQANNNGENRGRNGHVLIWEQPGLDDSERQPKNQRAWIGSRHVVTFMLFLGMANAYVMRTNMSVAIVAMVNHTASNDAAHDEIVVNECPETPYDSMENNPDVRELYTRVK